MTKKIKGFVAMPLRGPTFDALRSGAVQISIDPALGRTVVSTVVPPNLTAAVALELGASADRTKPVIVDFKAAKPGKHPSYVEVPKPKALSPTSPRAFKRQFGRHAGS